MKKINVHVTDLIVMLLIVMMITDELPDPKLLHLYK